MCLSSASQILTNELVFVFSCNGHSVPIGRVVFEIGGPVEIRLEVAKEGERCAALISDVHHLFLRSHN